MAFLVVTFMLSAGISWLKWPVPTLHDEFSYLLAADTYAGGRCTNATHPMWPHFESMHVLQQPSYASKYPPAQGLFLALGQILLGTPLAGVWLSTSAAVASIVWMLHVWFDRRWSIIGGCLALTHSGLMLSWGQTYMGGAPAVVGAALLLGGWKLWGEQFTWKSGVLAAAGLAILANSRPFEGLLVSLPVLISVAHTLFRRQPIRLSMSRGIQLIPGSLLLILVLLGMATYNKYVTGNMLNLPYALHSKMYMTGPLFVFQQPPQPAPEYRHEMLKEFHTDWETNAWQAQRSLASFLRVKFHYFSMAMMVLLSPVLGLLILYSVRRHSSTGRSTGDGHRNAEAGASGTTSFGTGLSRGQLIVLLSSLGLLLFGSSMAVWLYSHYLSPVLPVFFLLGVAGLRRLEVELPSPRVPNVSALAILLQSILFGVAVLRLVVGDHKGWQYDRQEVADSLNARDGQHLVVVQYATGHSPHEEWVYNRADIDASKIVWARDMGTDANTALLRYFAGRHVWYLRPDSEPENRLTRAIPGSHSNPVL
ncbi:MAG: hypothetical protein KDA91_09655 [Planctomycetaceae bacterium]|nr:hypothetical protein [Planctomycetaceae bacterium]